MQKRKTMLTGLALLVAGIGGSAVAAEVPPGTQLSQVQELVRNNGSEPATLDPQKGESNVESTLNSDFFEGLLRVKADGKLEPRLATSWEEKSDTVWVFHLRPEAKWSNGEPVKASDLVFSWRRLVDPKTASPYSSYLGNAHVVNAAAIANGKAAPDTLGVKALDDHTLEITLTQPTASILPMLAHTSLMPVNPGVVQKFGEAWTQPKNFVGNGAYVPTQWVVNERIVAERNKQYWDDSKTVINKVSYLTLSSETADINRYRAGEIAITNTIPLNQFAALKKSIPAQVKVEPFLSTYYYEFNTTKPPFNDARVRRALNMALDKDIIAEKVLAQGQRPAWLISQPEIGGVTLRSPDYAAWPMDKRISEAKKLLAEAGFNQSHPLSFKLLYNTMESHQRIAIAASAMWKKNLGVTATLQNQEWKTMLDTMHSGNFDLVRYAWVADYDDASSFLNNFRTGDSENTAKYSNPAYDAVLASAAKATDATSRGADYQKAEDILAQDVPAIPVYHYVRARLVKPWVGGFMPNKLDNLYTQDLYIIKHD